MGNGTGRTQEQFHSTQAEAEERVCREIADCLAFKRRQQEAKELLAGMTEEQKTENEYLRFLAL